MYRISQEYTIFLYFFMINSIIKNRRQKNNPFVKKSTKHYIAILCDFLRCNN